jgi:hypothetical protein
MILVITSISGVLNLDHFSCLNIGVDEDGDWCIWAYYPINSAAAKGKELLYIGDDREDARRTLSGMIAFIKNMYKGANPGHMVLDMDDFKAG